MSDILGAYAMGVRNMLCLSGDHQQFGNHPEAKNVYDIDSMQLYRLVKKMRDEGKFLNDEEIDDPPKLFIGAASNPFADPFEFRVYRLAKKIGAGADFIQTQCIYNMDKFRKFMKRAVDMGLTEKCYILAGVTPMKSVGMAQYMAKQVPGMDVPDELIDRLKGAGKGKVGRRGHQNRHRTDRGVQGDERRGRRASHGHRMGTPGARNCRTGRRVAQADCLIV